jgi:folate-binding protein YgfZ
MQATALHDFLAGRAGAMGDDHGIVVARHFGDAAREYAALRERAAVVDLGDRGIVAATGADRVTFLQGMLTNDVARLGPGTGCPALLLTIQGRVVADLVVSADAEALVLDVDRRAQDAMVGALDALIIADDVELAADEATTLVGVAGPDALGLVPAAAALAPYAHVGGEVGGVAVRVVRAGAAAPVAVVLHAPRSEASRVWESLVAAGAVACGRDALEARRIELGVPRIGIDMGEKTLALEVPVEEAVSATKGCYLGQEVIARGTARGHVNRRLCGLVFDGSPSPVAGAALLVDGREVGTVTSVAASVALGRAIGLGFVRREQWDPGTPLQVGSGTGGTVAHVAAWPLA